jgi:phage terminase small subunit
MADETGDATTEAAEKPLTQQQERFCEEFIVDLCGARAAIRAGYSPKTAKFQASHLLTQPNIAAYVAQLKAERSARTGITADRVLAELAVLAFSDTRDYAANFQGQMRLTAGAPSSAARAVAAIKRKKSGKELSVDFKLWDKNAALRMLMPHVGLVTERGEISGKDGKPIEHIVRVVREPFVPPVHDDDDEP